MDGRWGEKERGTAEEGDYWGRDGKDIRAEKEAEQKADKREKESESNKEKDLRAWPEFQILQLEMGEKGGCKIYTLRAGAGLQYFSHIKNSNPTKICEHCIFMIALMFCCTTSSVLFPPHTPNLWGFHGPHMLPVSSWMGSGERLLGDISHGLRPQGQTVTLCSEQTQSERLCRESLEQMKGVKPAACSSLDVHSLLQLLSIPSPCIIL